MSDEDLKNLTAVFTQKLMEAQDRVVILEVQLENANKTSARSKKNKALMRLVREILNGTLSREDAIARAKQLGVEL